MFTVWNDTISNSSHVQFSSIFTQKLQQELSPVSLYTILVAFHPPCQQPWPLRIESDHLYPPGISSSTLASVQNFSFRQIRLHNHYVTYWDLFRLSLFCFLHLSLARSRRLKKYLCCHLLVNWCSNHWWCLALSVKAWLTLNFEMLVTWCSSNSVAHSF